MCSRSRSHHTPPPVRRPSPNGLTFLPRPPQAAYPLANTFHPPRRLLLSMQPRSPASASAAAAAMAPGVGRNRAGRDAGPGAAVERPLTSASSPRLTRRLRREDPSLRPTSPSPTRLPARRAPRQQAAVPRASLSTRRSIPGSTSGAVIPGTLRSSTPSLTPPTRAWTRHTVVPVCTPLQGQDLLRNAPPWKVIHTVGPKYAVKYHTAAENALSHCYRSCLELLIENGLERRFLEKQKGKIAGVVFCTTSSYDTEIYKRLLPLYFPRDKQEEEIAVSKLPADVGDENGETVIDERKIRIRPLPAGVVERTVVMDLPLSDSGSSLKRSSFKLDSYLDPSFMSLIKDPDLRRKEQWEKSSQAQKGFNYARLLGYGDLGCPSLSAAEEYSLHSRYLAKANSLNLSEIAEMKIIYRGGVDSEGRPVMVVVGAHFLLRCLDLERFVLHVVKEFEPLIQKPYSIVYFHSAASLQPIHCKQAIYVLHPTLGLRTAILAMQMFVDGEVWKKAVYVDRLVQLFKYVPREQLTIPDFVFQHDLEVNGGRGLIVDPRTKHIYQRASSG
ncbi:hypothetical protein PR202_ga00366 [Eleusine coracana subsp. coracana]|uniref:CRAL-TRIO domain-containing protein n=1 Tax=Eleusine coracana subsp. coracana TaxID=191504 RepID=A0AAV5BCJ3_ELECO|nr:hypothetical protein PR202_ga00366 [Eleusine coracana subsp. coracana]